MATKTKRAGKGVIPKTWTTARVRRNAQGKVQVLIGRKANPVARKRKPAKKRAKARKTARKTARRRR